MRLVFYCEETNRKTYGVNLDAPRHIHPGVISTKATEAAATFRQPRGPAPLMAPRQCAPRVRHPSQESPAPSPPPPPPSSEHAALVGPLSCAGRLLSPNRAHSYILFTFFFWIIRIIVENAHRLQHRHAIQVYGDNVIKLFHTPSSQMSYTSCPAVREKMFMKMFNVYAFFFFFRFNTHTHAHAQHRDSTQGPL